MGGYELGEVESRLIGSIYEAAFDLTRWKLILVDICEYISANEASLLFYDSQIASRNFVETAYNINNDEFVEKHLAEEVKTLRVIFAGCSPGQLLVANHIAEQLGMSYEEYLGAPAKIAERQAYQVRLGIPLITDGPTYAAMGFHCLYGAPELSAEAVEFVSRITPHLVKALCLYNQNLSMRAERHSLIEAIKFANSATVLVDRNLKILFLSDCAKKALEINSELIFVNMASALEVRSGYHQARFLALFSKVVLNYAPGHKPDIKHHSISLCHAKKQHPLKLRIHRIEQDKLMTHEDIPCAVIFIQDAEHIGYLSSSYLKEAYGFTAAESKIAQFLLQGLPLTEISKKRCRSQETTRWQIKQIMQKTGTHSQSELMRLFMVLGDEVSLDDI